MLSAHTADNYIEIVPQLPLFDSFADPNPPFPSAKGNEANLLPVSASKLVQYALARPIYLGFIAKDLSNRAKKEWTAERYGFALIALSAIEQLVEACGASTSNPTTDASALAAFEASVIDVINAAIGHPNGNIRAAAARLCGKFIAGQDILVDQARLAEFLVPLLSIISAINCNSVTAADLAALQALKELISKSTPQALVDHVTIIVPILLPLLHHALRVLPKAAPALAPTSPAAGAGALRADAPSVDPAEPPLLTLIDACIGQIASSVNPAVATGLFGPFLSYFDDNQWQPREVVMRVLLLLEVTISGSRNQVNPDPALRALVSKPAAYSIPIFVVLLRHLTKLDDQFSALANALVTADKVPALGSVDIPVWQEKDISVAPLPEVPSPLAVISAKSAKPTAEPHLHKQWMGAFRTGAAVGAPPDEVAHSLVSTLPVGAFPQMEYEYTITRLMALQHIQVLIDRSTIHMATYSHDLMEVVIPVLIEPSEGDMEPKGSPGPAAALHQAAFKAFFHFLQRVPVPQNTLRIASELCDWYLNHVAETASVLSTAIPGAEHLGAFHAHSASALGRLQSRRSEALSVDSSSALTSPTNLQAASVSRRLSRNLVAALAATGLSPQNRSSRSGSRADSADLSGILNFINQSARQATAARRRLLDVLLLTARRTRLLCTTAGMGLGAMAGPKTRLNIPKSICLTVEAAIIESDDVTRAKGLMLLDDILNLQQPCEVESSQVWATWASAPFAPEDLLISSPSQPPGWLLNASPVDSIRLPQRELGRIFGALFEAVTGTLRIRETAAHEGVRYECSSAMSEADKAVAARILALASTAVRDCLVFAGLDALWKAMALALTLQTAAEQGSPVTAGTKAVSATAAVETAKATAAALATIQEEDEAAGFPTPSISWEGTWPLCHAFSLSVVRGISYALGSSDLTEWLASVDAARLAAGKGEAGLLTVQADGIIAPPTALPEQGSEWAQAEETLDFSYIATLLLQDAGFRQLLAKNGLNIRNSAAGADITAQPPTSARTSRFSLIVSPGKSMSFHDLGLATAAGKGLTTDDGTDEATIHALLVSKLVLLPKDFMLKELFADELQTGKESQSEKHPHTRISAVVEGEEENLTDQVGTPTNTGVPGERPGTVTAFHAPLLTGGATDVQAVKLFLTRDSKAAASRMSALDYEKMLLEQESGRPATLTKQQDAPKETEVVRASLDPLRRATWLQLSTDPATFWEIESSRGLVQYESKV